MSGGLPATLKAPAGLAVDSAGNVYVADTGDNRFRKARPAAHINTVPVVLSAPTGLAFDSSGNLYIAESAAYRLSRMTPDGSTTPYAGMSFNTVSAAPRAAGSERVGRSLRRGGRSVRHCLRRRPGRPTPAHHQQLHSIESNFDAVSGVASDAQGNISFSDPQQGMVWRLLAGPPALTGQPTVPLRFRRLPNSRPEAETDDAPPPIASRDVILPSHYDSA
jgi:hypothetical protein